MPEKPTWGKDKYESEKEFLSAKDEERHEKRQELIVGMRQALENMNDRDTIKEEIKRAQNEVLEKIPGDFFENLKGHVLVSPYEQAIYGKEESLTKQDIKRLIAGELFEELVRADVSIAPKETERAATLRQFMYRPERYGLGGMIEYHLRNPDLAVVNDQGKIVGWVECKTGFLDDRAEKQFSDSPQGFRASFTKALRIIRNISDRTLERSGLEIFTGEENKKTLYLADNLELILAVPHGNFANDYENLMGPKVKNRKKFSRILETQYKIKESPFSRKELGVLTDYLADELFPEKEN